MNEKKNFFLPHHRNSQKKQNQKRPINFDASKRACIYVEFLKKRKVNL